MAGDNCVSKRVVYKLGGSILRRSVDYTFYANRLSDELRDHAGVQLVVVVSARYGHTDRLLTQVRAAGGDDEAAATSLLLATGELQSVARLTFALTRTGVNAVGVGPEQTGITLQAGTAAENRLRVDPARIESFLSDYQVVVVPGFVGTTATGAWVTLGRGGSDLSAVALAAALKAERCELIKDVPGYFTADPKREAEAQHLSALDYQQAIQMAVDGCDLVQLDALRYAHAQRLQLIIRDLKTRARRTTVSAMATEQADAGRITDVLAVA